MKIDQIWNEMEADKSIEAGMLLRRYSGAILSDIFVGLVIPGRIRCIVVSVDKSLQVDTSLFSTLKDVQVELATDNRAAAKNTVLFKLLNSEHTDVFSVLCEDLMISIVEITDERLLIQELFNRFDKWKSLFERITSQGLTSEEQRGLYAEMYLLRKYLLMGIWPYSSVIKSWVGPNKEVKDFQYRNWAIEVKSSSGNSHQAVQISNERQLDASNLEYLFLFHLSLEKRKQSGESINQLIQSVQDVLVSDRTALVGYRNKLLEAGYFNHHSSLYDETGYIIRDEVFYRVDRDFPRIEERDIRNGVGDVKYSIILSRCSDFITNKEHVFALTTF